MLNGSATKRVNINKVETKVFMKVLFHFPFQVGSSAPKVSSYNEITCEFTYLVIMSAKPISAATREITPFLLTVVKIISAVCIQVLLHIMVCFGSETKYTSNKLLC
jgi:hypothetical protein